MYFGGILQQGMLYYRFPFNTSLNIFQSCQEKGWIERDHKRECKLLRDRDFRLLSELGWRVFEDYKKFEGPG